MALESLVGALVLAGVHVFAGRLTFLDVIPRSRWLSLAGGIGVAYALVHLLPELEGYQSVLRESLPAGVGDHVGERLVWVLLLLGLVVYYGVERVGQWHDRRREGASAWFSGCTSRRTGCTTRCWGTSSSTRTAACSR